MSLPGLTILDQFHVLCVLCKNTLFTRSPTIYLAKSLACPNHFAHFTCSHGWWCRWRRPWGDVISGGQEAATQSSFHQPGRHGNNFEMMMVMIRVLKPGLLVDKEYISFIYWSWIPKVKGIIWTILLFVTSSSASMNQTQEGEYSSRWTCVITQNGFFC